MVDYLATLDTWAYRLINGDLGSSWIDPIMLFASDRNVWILAGCLLVGVGVYKKSQRILSLCIIMAVSLILVDFVAYRVLKQSIARERPCYALEDVRLVPPRCGSDYGMPSNHAANGAAALAVGFVFSRRWRVLALGGPVLLLVGFSRVYLGVHYPGDVLVGFLFGGSAGVLVYLGVRRILEKLRLPGCWDSAATEPSLLP